MAAGGKMASLQDVEPSSKVHKSASSSELSRQSSIPSHLALICTHCFEQGKQSLWDLDPYSIVRETDTSYRNEMLLKTLGISYRDHVTNKEVRNRMRQATGAYEALLTTVKKRKLRWYGHITR